MSIQQDVTLYSLITSLSIGKPWSFCSTEKEATSQDDHSQQCGEVAGLSWARSLSIHTVKIYINCTSLLGV